jgi:hypothetical protein
VNHPLTTQVQTASSEAGSPDRRAGEFLLPGSQVPGLQAAPKAQPASQHASLSPGAAPVDQSGPVARPNSEGRDGQPAGSLGLTELVNRLREVYPHPTNRGTPRRVPTPVAVEQWLAEKIRTGDLRPDAYHVVLSGAVREARLAEAHPDTFRSKLRTWIREAGWGEEIETEQDADPDLPPPTTGPRFTPPDWNQPKENPRDRLDDRSRR